MGLFREEIILMRRMRKVFFLCLLGGLVSMACNLPTMIEATGVPRGTPVPGTETPPAAPTALPEAATVTPAPAVTPGGQGAECTYKAVFVEDVTIPDNSVVPKGQSFVKTWRVRNEGTCTWGPVGRNLHALAFTSGEDLNAPAEVPLPGDVPPGSEVDISVTMQAPGEAGRYISNWLFRVDGDASGIHWVGVGEKGADPLYAMIRVLEGD